MHRKVAKSAKKSSRLLAFPLRPLRLGGEKNRSLNMYLWIGCLLVSGRVT
jgi:hypothetical protein